MAGINSAIILKEFGPLVATLTIARDQNPRDRVRLSDIGFP
jgi:hypothetical protein